MIKFENVSKSYRVGKQHKQILRNFSFDFPNDRNIALIGRNGAGKTTFLSLISGTSLPDKGKVTRQASISWPLGFGGAFHPLLTGRQNSKFVARIYGVKSDQLVSKVISFADLGGYFDMPVRTYSQGMKARLAFGVSMAVEFKCYLVDEIIGVGDEQFRRKCQVALQDRLKNSQVIMASHSKAMLRLYCQSAFLIENGTVEYFDDLEAGLEKYKQIFAD